MIKVFIMVSKQIVQGTDAQGIATLDVRTGNRTQRMVVTGTQTFHMNIGDSIKCISGTAVAYINPGTAAGAYILTPKPPLNTNGKYVTLLNITLETTRDIHRGSIHSVEDIGNINRGTATSR